NLPDDLTYTACGDTTFSFDVSGYDVDDNLVGCSMISGPGTLENGVWTFTTSGPGTYTASFECIDECGLTCSGEVTITVEGGDSPVIACPPSDEVFLCGPEIVSVPLSFAPANAELIITPQADYSNGMLTFLADTAGTYCFAVEAITACGTDVCQFCITVSFNSPPVATCPGDIEYVFSCEPQEICFGSGFTSTDPDNNIFSETVSHGVLSGGSVCFTPDTAGVYEIRYTVTDDCGAIDECVSYVTVRFENSPPVCNLPDDLTYTACGDTTFSFDVSGYDVDDNLVGCSMISGPGTLENG
ncbi:MAG: hypothetical protein GY841_01375, partial [FCB group bacterium]|nr:hypothetical protein [FCB group bacterium]